MLLRTLPLTVLCLVLVSMAQASVFGPPVSYRVGASACSIDVGDFNNDGIPDILAGNVAGGVRVLLGNGDGTFQAGVLTRFPHGRFGIACSPRVIGDFNGDGKLDLLVIFPNGQVQVFAGNGDGTFNASGNTGTGATFTATADFNEDGIPDLLLLRPKGACEGRVLLGNGDGTFRAGSNIFVGGGCLLVDWPFVIGDFNSDGHQDVLMVEIGEAVILAYDVAFGNGDGTFQTPLVTTMQNATIGNFVVRDINGDGIADLTFSSESQGDIGVQFGAGDGTFPESFPTYCNTGLSSDYLQLGDFDGDGVPDAIFQTYYTLSLYFARGRRDGTFVGCTLLDAGPSPYGFVIADFNGDGALDVAVANNDTSGIVSVLLNTR